MKRTFRKRIIRRAKPRDCFFCKQKVTPDYKEVETLKHFISERGKINGKRQSGVCQKHQHKLSQAVKQARFLALLPFIVRPS